MCGIISIFLSFAYAELGTLIRRQGGDYTYILQGLKGFHKFFGPLPAFLFLWMKLVTGPATVAIAALSFARYIVFPFFPDCDTPLYVIRIVAAFCILSVVLINMSSVTLVSRVLVLFTTVKMATIGMIVIAGIVRMTQGHTHHLSTGFDGSATSPGSYAVACYMGLFGFEGWDNLCTVVEEMVNPKRNVPLCLFSGISIVIVVYILANCSYFTVMSPYTMQQSGAVVMSWAEHVIGPASYVIPVLVACSVFGMLTSLILTDSRIFFAGAREGQLMSALSMVHVTKATPMPVLCFQATLGFIYTCVSDIYSLMRYRIFCEIVFRAMTICCLVILRRTANDNRNNVFKTPAPILGTSILLCFFLIVAPVVDKPRIETLYAVLMVLVGIVFYVPFVYYKIKLPFVDKLTRFIQKLFLVVPTME
ncbi:b(0,+)-type amino acid transporter 1-like isoform X2 [Lineus longissimus]